MIAHPDTGSRKRKAPCANTGRLSLIGLVAVYHIASTVQWLIEICLIVSGGFIAGLDDYIQSRRAQK